MSTVIVFSQNPIIKPKLWSTVSTDRYILTMQMRPECYFALKEILQLKHHFSLKYKLYKVNVEILYVIDTQSLEN